MQRWWICLQTGLLFEKELVIVSKNEHFTSKDSVIFTCKDSVMLKHGGFPDTNSAEEPQWDFLPFKRYRLCQKVCLDDPGSSGTWWLVTGSFAKDIPAVVGLLFANDPSVQRSWGNKRQLRPPRPRRGVFLRKGFRWWTEMDLMFEREFDEE